MNIIVKLPGVEKQITLKVDFDGYSTTWCSIRKGNKVLGAGVAYRNYGEPNDAKLAKVLALKRAAKTAWFEIFRCLSQTDQQNYMSRHGMSRDIVKAVSSAYRWELLDEDEQAAITAKLDALEQSRTLGEYEKRLDQIAQATPGEAQP